jgi:hypothetical protein
LLADGLMSLRENTRRTLTVIACLPGTWTILTSVAVATVPDRFRQTTQLHRIKDTALAQKIIEKRFLTRFTEIGFKPPFDSWPIRPEAFAHAGPFTPRELLVRIDQHIRACITNDRLELLDTIGDPAQAEPRSQSPAPPPITVSADDMTRFDERFAELKLAADDITPPSNPAPRTRPCQLYSQLG